MLAGARVAALADTAGNPLRDTFPASVKRKTGTYSSRVP
jgi:hypothetical protein